MLERFHRIALVLLKVRLLLLLAGLAGLAGFGLSLFEAEVLDGQQIMMPSLVVFFWGATGISFSALFSHLPQPVPENAGIRQRWSYKLQRAFYSALALFMIALSLSLLVLSYQLIRAWSML